MSNDTQSGFSQLAEKVLAGKLSALNPAGFSSVKDVSEFTSKSIPTIYRWCKSGLLPPSVRIGPNSVAWRNAELLEWAADPAAWADAHRTGQQDWIDGLEQ